MPYLENEKGFTLVEIAIVMVVIGLIIGGLLLGQNVLFNAKLKGTYAKTEIFETALAEFTTKYSALPGDMGDALARLPACPGCANGNGDGVTGDPTQPIFTAAGPADETTQFWYHLTAADMINDVQIGAAPGAGDTWGQSLPIADADGGYQVRSMGGQFADDGEPVMGIFVRWQRTPFIAANAANGLVVSPAHAFEIDSKFDDGIPLRGRVRGRGTDGANGADNCKTNATTYIQNDNSTTGCYMYFRIRNTPGL